jgi:hypothetical protein
MPAKSTTTAELIHSPGVSNDVAAVFGVARSTASRSKSSGTDSLPNVTGHQKKKKPGDTFMHGASLIPSVSATRSPQILVPVGIRLVAKTPSPESGPTFDGRTISLSPRRPSSLSWFGQAAWQAFEHRMLACQHGHVASAQLSHAQTGQKRKRIKNDDETS